MRTIQTHATAALFAILSATGLCAGPTHAQTPPPFDCGKLLKDAGAKFDAVRMDEINVIKLGPLQETEDSKTLKDSFSFKENVVADPPVFANESPTNTFNNEPIFCTVILTMVTMNKIDDTRNRARIEISGTDEFTDILPVLVISKNLDNPIFREPNKTYNLSYLVAFEPKKVPDKFNLFAGKFETASKQFSTLPHTGNEAQITGIDIAKLYPPPSESWWRSLIDRTADKNPAYHLSSYMMVICPDGPCKDYFQAPQASAVTVDTGAAAADTPQPSPIPDFSEAFTFKVLGKALQKEAINTFAITQKMIDKKMPALECIISRITTHQNNTSDTCKEFNKSFRNGSVIFEPPDRLVIVAESAGGAPQPPAQVIKHRNFIVKPPRGYDPANCNLEIQATGEVWLSGRDQKTLLDYAKDKQWYEKITDANNTLQDGDQFTLTIYPSNPRDCAIDTTPVTLSGKDASVDGDTETFTIDLAGPSDSRTTLVFLPMFNDASTTQWFKDSAGRRIWGRAMLAAMESAHRRLNADRSDAPWHIADSVAILHEAKDSDVLFSLSANAVRDPAAINTAFPSTDPDPINRYVERNSTLSEDRLTGLLKAKPFDANAKNPRIIVVLGRAVDAQNLCQDPVMENAATTLADFTPGRQERMIWLPLVDRESLIEEYRKATKGWIGNVLESRFGIDPEQFPDGLLPCGDSGQKLETIPFVAQSWYDSTELAQRYSVAVGDYLGKLLQSIAFAKGTHR